MVSKSKLGVLTLVTVLLVSLSIGLVAAQYVTQKTTEIAIGSDGTFVAGEADVGITYEIRGVAGATGSVTASVYAGNPQATAAIPGGVWLTHFVVITFDMSPLDFTQATIILSYSDSMVQNVQLPYAIYKYDAGSDSYVELPSTVDTAAKTITVTLTSVDDPLLAIGGATAAGESLPLSTWAVIIVSVVAILLLVVFIFARMRGNSGSTGYSYIREGPKYALNHAFSFE
jgi:hypothetical protein